MQPLIDLFEKYTHHTPELITQLPASGSNRKYYRIKCQSIIIIGVIGTSVDENNAFIFLSRYFKKQDISVPEVFAVSDDGLCYLQEDLGDVCLFDFIKSGSLSGKFMDDQIALLKTTVSLLPKIQYQGAEGLDFSVCYPQPQFDARLVAFDLNYFKYDFLKLSGLEFNEILLQNDFDKMSKVLLKEPTNTFMYRDFQSRNVMIKNGKPYFIDFQGGRKGPVYYDVASFLWQAKANYPAKLREELLQTYLQSLQQYVSVDELAFKKRLRHFVLFRMLQVLGAYGFRGLFEKRNHFLQSIPFAMENLKQLLSEPFNTYPYLSTLLLQLTELPQFAKQEAPDHLIVEIYSFSYKKGIPNDYSGNGGGYVFDCRSINNPGRYEQYKHMTGQDPEVIGFLENDGEIITFLDHVYALVDAHVERFMERKFTHLFIAFGCTGGQHRSVYCAEHTAEHLFEKYGVDVLLVHREQNLQKRLTK